MDARNDGAVLAPVPADIGLRRDVLPPVGVRWTIGDVAPRGFEALRLSVWGAWRVFGPAARYAVCVNSMTVAQARIRVGPLPDGVQFVQADERVPVFVRDRFDGRFAEGVGWKFAPPVLFADRHEIALDNDCILWSLPESLRRWLQDGDGRCLMAEDVRPCFGRFATLGGDRPLNSGIRGIPPRYDLVGNLEEALARVPGTLDSELDEQGLQAAALSRSGPLHVVDLDEVAVCSPFPPHRPGPGSCGVHFVGLNRRRYDWEQAGQPAEVWIAAHFDAWYEAVRTRVDVPARRPAVLPPADARRDAQRAG